MTVLKSMDLNGKKLSFANWVSNIYPFETPFLSMINKEDVDQTVFQWQSDVLVKAGENAYKEGASAVGDQLHMTAVRWNYTQIFRKVVKVSKTANKVGTYGRENELKYQMAKAVREMKLSIEWAFLQNLGGAPESEILGRVTAGFHAQVAPLNTPHSETGAVVHKVASADIGWGGLMDLDYELYMAGANPNVIMVHPDEVSRFSYLQESPRVGSNRVRVFEDTTKAEIYVNTITSPLGTTFSIIPNRLMPRNTAYMFNPEDWTAMMLRPPKKTKLDSDGSYEKWMIECEVGLRHKHPYASGIYSISSKFHRSDVWGSPVFCGFVYTKPDGTVVTLPMNAQVPPTDENHIRVDRGSKMSYWAKANDSRHRGAIAVLRDGIVIHVDEFPVDEGTPMCSPKGLTQQPTSYDKTTTIVGSMGNLDSGYYTIQLVTVLPDGTYDASFTRGVRLFVE